MLAGANPAQLTTVATATRSGFETAIGVQSSAPDFAVQALNARGQALGISPVTRR